jgi:Ca2+-binding EF-hand superfamily protein
VISSVEYERVGGCQVRLREVFNEFDSDNSGCLEANELGDLIR